MDGYLIAQNVVEQSTKGGFHIPVGWNNIKVNRFHNLDKMTEEWGINFGVEPTRLVSSPLATWGGGVTLVNSYTSEELCPAWENIFSADQDDAVKRIANSQRLQVRFFQTADELHAIKSVCRPLQTQKAVSVFDSNLRVGFVAALALASLRNVDALSGPRRIYVNMNMSSQLTGHMVVCAAYTQLNS